MDGAFCVSFSTIAGSGSVAALMPTAGEKSGGHTRLYDEFVVTWKEPRP